MDGFGIFDPRLVQRLKEDWQRTMTEVRRATAPILDGTGRVLAGVFDESIFRPTATGPTTPLDGCDWEQVGNDAEALRQRLERTIADLAIVESQTVTLDNPSGPSASFMARVVLTDGTTWQARVPVTSVARATEAELRLWALRLAGKVRQ